MTSVGKVGVLKIGMDKVDKLIAVRLSSLRGSMGGLIGDV